MKYFRTFGSKVPTGLSKLLSSVLMNFLWKKCRLKKNDRCFLSVVCGFLARVSELFCRVVKTCIVLVNRQQEHLGKDLFLWNNFHFRYRGKITWGFSCRMFPACLQQLLSRHRGERFEEKPFSRMVIYDICSTFFRLWSKLFLTPSGKTPAQ